MKSYQWFAAALGAMTMFGCAAEAPKQEIADAPFAGDWDGKDDSWRYPIDGGDMLVGEQVGVDFDAGHGWIAYEVELRAGAVDVDLAAEGAGSLNDLDPLLVVYGPRRSDGRYPKAALAVNDDVAPGVNNNAQIALAAPVDGVYRVVASTFWNYVAWPDNVSEGRALLTIKCPRTGDGGLDACGPHVGGELDSAWATMLPAQCGGNPWDESAEDERAAIAAHYEAAGVEIRELGLVDPQLGAVCEACSCPRGDRLLVRATRAGAATLASDHGFDAAADVGAWLSYTPEQCGGNPWDESAEDERQAVRDWAAGLGVAIETAGFVYPAEPTFHCLACQCARGDRLVVTGATPGDVERLLALGFAPL